MSAPEAMTPHGAQTLLLPAILDLSAAAPLADRLLHVRGADVALDASQVARLGGQCLQVLMAAGKTWAADRAKFEISTPSPEFVDALARFGVEPNTFVMRGSSI
jgi:chemotaxis protein CheX